MYEPFFGFEKRPFAATPDAQSLVLFPWLKDLKNDLLHCLQRGQGVAVLTGAAGTGKTLLCQCLRNDLDNQFKTIMLQTANFPTPRSLVQSILFELERPYLNMDESELRIELNAAIRSLAEDDTALIVIVDEAHQLSSALLLELRNMINLTSDGVALVRLLLSGQIQLEENVMDPAVAVLNERIAAQVHLQSLTRQESAFYLEKKLDLVGSCMEEIFTEEAIETICHASDGVPRSLNQLSDHALLLAYLAERKVVDIDLVREALNDLKQLPLQWNDTSHLEDSLDEPIEDEVVNTTLSNEHAETTDDFEATLVHESDNRDDFEFQADWPTETVANEDVPQHEIIAVEVGAGDDKPENIQTDAEFTATPDAEESLTTEEQLWDNIEAMQEIVNLALHDDASDQVSDLTCAPESEVIFDSLNYDVVQFDSEETSDSDQTDELIETISISEPAQSEQRMETISMDETINITDSRNESEFVEIPIQDRYAIIDSGKPLPIDFKDQTVAVLGEGFYLPEGTEMPLNLEAESPASFDRPIIIAAGGDATLERHPCVTRSEDCTNFDNFPGEDKLWEPYPSALTDDVLPLLALAKQKHNQHQQSAEVCETQSEENIVIAQRVTEPGSVTLLSLAKGNSTLTATSNPIVTDPPICAETDTGATVLNVFARLQENISDFLNNVNTADIAVNQKQDKLGQPENCDHTSMLNQTSECDASVPGKSKAQTGQTRDRQDDEASQNGARPYGNLFSRLRRRLQRGH